VLRHECILLVEPGTDEVWFFRAGEGATAVPMTGRLRVLCVCAGLAAARAGLGVVRLPSSRVTEQLRAGLLVPVLEAERPPGIPVFAVYPSNRQHPLKVRASLDLLSERSPLCQGE